MLWKATVSLILLILSYVFKDRTTKKWLRIASLILILWEVGQLLYSMFFVKKLTGQQTLNPGILQAPGLPPNYDPGKYFNGTSGGMAASIPVTPYMPPKTVTGTTFGSVYTTPQSNITFNPFNGMADRIM